MRRLVIGALLSLSTVCHAQGPVDISIIRPDTTRLNESFGSVQEYKRPKIYDAWFKRIAECEGLKLPPQEEIDRIKFFVVNSETFKLNSDSGVAYYAVTYSRLHYIVMALPQVYNYAIVAHEFLHFNLWYSFGDKYQGYHPLEYYSKCEVTEFNK